MESSDAQQCEVGILFADIAGSTRIYEMLGDQRALAIVNQCFRIMAEPIAAHTGVIVKTVGDELMAAFNRPVSAIAAAIEIQRRIEQLPPLPIAETPLKVGVRIGLHFGTALREHQDFFGDTVNIASRMVALSKAQQILTTVDMLEDMPPMPNMHALEIGTIEVKGRNEPVRVAQIRWEEEHVRATVFGAERPVEAVPRVRMVLTFRDREWPVDDSCRLLSIGRDVGCAIQLNGLTTSRSHATLERRRGKWYLLDHSTNGTNLVQDGIPGVRLHREESVLAPRGRLFFGKLGDPDTEWCDYAITPIDG